MPRTRSLAWSELKLGVLTIVALIIAAITIFLVTGGRGFFWQRYTLKTRFADVAGLKPGSPVRLAGVEIGAVKAVDIAGATNQVDVTFEVNRDYRSHITTVSTAKLGSVSLLGEGAVDITPSSLGTPIPEFGYVPAAKPPAQLSDLTESASDGINEITGLVHDLRQGKGTAGKLIADDRLYTELQNFVNTAGELARGIRQGRGTLGRLVTDRKAADSLEASMKNLEAMTARINSGQGSLGKLLQDSTFADSLIGATANLRDLTAHLNSGEGTAGKLVTDPTLFNRLNSLTDRFNQLITKMNDGQGTAGQLLNDKQLYENMNGAVADLRKLIADISKDPKRYLNVRVSIF
jgi:phospholipid/cholesterol/gamma-HCH transport system substrate-binding protein